MIWFLIALLASIVALGLALPVMRGVKGQVSDGRGVFAGQLAELERDRELGFIDADASRQAELDIRRRMSLANARRDDDSVEAHAPSQVLRRGLVAGSGLAQIAAFSNYLAIGSL